MDAGAVRGVGSLYGLAIDYGGVLAVPVDEAEANFAAAEGLPLGVVRSVLRELQGETDAYECGDLEPRDFEAVICKVLLARHGVSAEQDGFLVRLSRHFCPVPAVFAAVRKVRRSGARTALVANSWARETYPDPGVLAGLFDVVVLSREAGLRKPDPAVFALALEGLAVPAHQCLFVDDSAANVAAANAAGMVALHHQSAEATVKLLQERFPVRMH